ncbi:MAG: c-type cytochrome [Planctomycetes bacterium]|nr:c-type cytochrome [Planctomycetota bacterium]
MLRLSAARTAILAALVAALVPTSCSKPALAPALPPTIAGLTVAGLAPRLRGEVLLGELGCTACHAPADARDPIDARAGPDLSAVGARVDAAYLERFLADPLRTEPGTTMPDVLAALDADERGSAARALTHYLRTLGGPAAPPAPHDAAAAARGAGLFATVGCVACHAPRDDRGAELATPGSVPLGALGRKYSPDALRAFLLAPLDVRPAGRMPDFGLSPQEAYDLSYYLTGPTRARVTRAATEPDKALVERGRALVSELHCGACHTGVERTEGRLAPRLFELDPKRGCLSDADGAWPRYALSDAQRADLRAALADSSPAWSDEERIRIHLVARNCVACHARDGFGGPSPERNEHFTTDDLALGEAGRLPPPLTGVGGKLQPQWLHDAIAHGQRARPYLHTRMPGFGADCGATLTALFQRADPVPERAIAPLPEERDASRAVRDLGCELVGDQGMNCISCHAFAGTSVGGMAAIDLVATTNDRLRPEWFHAYLLDPTGYRSTTIMPRFFIDGASTRADLGDGTPAGQISAMWHYLAEGRNTRRPRGLRNEPIELTVGDDAVLLRRAVQNTGKRGISVGYPGGVSVTFDAESLAVNQIWWGRFLDVAPVFHGQGSGQAHVQGREHVVLGRGPAFAELSDPAAAWPAVSRRTLGHRFVGYDLDAHGRPTFRYTCGDVTITDAAREDRADGAARPSLRRTLSFATERATTVTFRAATHADLAEHAPGIVRIGALEIAVPPDSYAIHDAGDARELRLRIDVPTGGTSIELRYRWQEDGR